MDAAERRNTLTAALLRLSKSSLIIVPLNFVIGRNTVSGVNPLKSVSSVNKVKAVPLQAWSGPDVSRKLRFPD